MNHTNQCSTSHKKLTVTVGIPAYNEAFNIAALLKSLLNQQSRSAAIEHIVVISDGSTDATVSQAQSVRDNRITVVRGRKRLGQSQRQNQIFDTSSSDIVVLLNADVLPVGTLFIEEIVKPFLIDTQVALVGAKVIPLTRSDSLVGQVLDWHQQWKNDLFEQINQADTVYLCHGRARAFSKQLYTSLRWRDVGGEDAYSYKYTKMSNLGFAFAPEAVVWYASPKTIADHMRQSARFLHTKRAKTGMVDSVERGNWYAIPGKLLVKSIAKALVTNPVYALIYGLMFVGSVGLYLLTLHHKQQHVWSASVSTKSLNFS